jgi:hypothetical protein
MGTTYFIQDIINETNVKFVFDGEFDEGMKFKTHALRTFFLKYHDQIGMNIGRKFIGDEGNGMIMNTTGRMKSLGSGKNYLMFGEDGWRSGGTQSVSVEWMEWSCEIMLE